MRISPYRLVFLAGFFVIPGIIWGIQVRPTMQDRVSYIQRQQNALTVQKKNKLLPTQRNSLSATWGAFRPTADAALANLANDLNPHLVQKRLYDTAEELNCDLRIQPKSALEGDTSVRFVISGEGRYRDLVQMVDRLEQGQHYVRFEKLSFTMPTQEYANSQTGAVRVVGVVLIPMMPAGIDQPEATRG